MRWNIKALVLFGLLTTLLWLAISYGTTAKEKYLIVWSGDQSRKAPDFLTVINFDDKSPDYGKIITTLKLAGPGSTNNEPHHVGLSSDGNVMAAGGLLSVLSGQKEIFFFDVSNPAKPRFLSSADPPQSAITDEFYPLPRGGFLVTMMGGAGGHHPGRVAEFDKNLNLVAEYPANPPENGFNPHGISVRAELNLMVTSDFICPSSTLASTPGELQLRGGIRVWNYEKRQIVKSIDIPDAGGTIDVSLIPGDPEGRAYTAGMISDRLYLVDTKNGTAAPVFDFATVAKGGWPQLMKMTRDGRRLFISLNQAGLVMMLDTTDPAKPKLMKTLELGKESGPHYIALSKDEKRLVITDYFLNEDSAGKVHAEGDHKIHVARITASDLVRDDRFSVDMDTVTGSPARPHGVVLK